MTLNLSTPATVTELKPRIVVFGIGGAGGNAVNNMINAQLEGVEFVVTNTDAQALTQSLADRRIQLGINATQGLGAGSRPEVGREAAEEARDHILDHLQGSHMVFITAGMGGGTGTGAAPVVAQLARDCGILTVAVVTKPFHFEGAHRMAIADQGIEDLHAFVDTLIMIPNQNLFRVANEKTTFADAFKMADDVLYSGVRGVTDLMVMPGLINLDFADIRSVMMEMGKAMMGTGEADGEKRALEAAEAAISNPLLDDVSMKGAHGVLINITGGPDMTLFEVDEAANRIRDEVDPDANIIFGSTFDESLEGAMRVSVVSTGIEAEACAHRPEILMRATEAIASPVPVAESTTNFEETVDEQPAVVPIRRLKEIQAAALAPSEPVAPPATAAQPAADGGSSGEAVAHAVAVARAATAPAAAAVASVADPSVMPASAAAPPADTGEPAAPPPSAEAPSTPDLPRPGAPERAARDADHFIPPRPVEAGSRRGFLGRPEPFAEAAVTNAASAERRVSRGPSLFERMTGSGRARKADDQGAMPTDAAAESAVGPSDGGEEQVPLAPSLVRSEATPTPRADLADRAIPTQPDEDLLEIPAFLRRQAN